MVELAPVTVYSTPTCPWCDRTKEYLTERQVPFIEKDVAADMDAAREMILISGQQGVPVVSTESEVIVGFDQIRLSRIADRYASSKRPVFGVLGANADDYFSRHKEQLPAGETEVRGVYVGKVKANSVAARGGLLPGDVIQALANKRVRGMSGLDALIESVRTGDQVSVRVLRNGEDVNLTLDFAEEPATAQA
ncbi:MAG TPA: glutaredoxin domain-containing protein [Thermomicrobiales bacterium]|nr:glutaredoxin domain-containing protein [Thermomicrobiales bacterium]